MPSFFHSGYLHQETDKAYLIKPEERFYSEGGEWIPKSKVLSVTIAEQSESGRPEITVEIPEWLAQKKSLC